MSSHVVLWRHIMYVMCCPAMLWYDVFFCVMCYHVMPSSLQKKAFINKSDFPLTLVLDRCDVTLTSPVNSVRKDNIAGRQEGGSTSAVTCSVSKKQVLKLSGRQISKLVHGQCEGMLACIVSLDNLQYQTTFVFMSDLLSQQKVKVDMGWSRDMPLTITYQALTQNTLIKHYTEKRLCTLQWYEKRLIRIQESFREKRKVRFLRVYEKIPWHTFGKGR